MCQDHMFCHNCVAESLLVTTTNISELSEEARLSKVNLRKVAPFVLIGLFYSYTAGVFIY